MRDPESDMAASPAYSPAAEILVPPRSIRSRERLAMVEEYCLACPLPDQQTEPQ
jgi:hypothetical protein